MTSILVTDGEQRAALAAVRSLGRSGYATYVCSWRRRSLAGGSRYALREDVVAHPLEAPRRFLEDLTRLIDRWGIDVLLPITEASLLAVLAQRDSLGGVIIPFPDLETFRSVSDKKQVLERARVLGIAVPSQMPLMRSEERYTLQLSTLHFPLVIKPYRSVVDSGSGRTQIGVRYAVDSNGLEAQLNTLPDEAYPVLLQQRIVGPGIGVFLLLWEGRTLAVFSHRRIREKPPTGGVSVYCESIPPDQELVKASETLLEHVGWQGVAMVEYKQDEVSGVKYLMEVNGRFWGSLQLAIDAGMDFPSLLVQAALGKKIEPQLRYRTGIRNRWFWGEVDHLLARWRAPSNDPELPPGMPGRLRALGQFLVAWRPGVRSQTFRPGDPIPFLRETLAWLRRQ